MLNCLLHIALLISKQSGMVEWYDSETCIEGILGSAGALAIVTEGFYGFPQFLLVSAKTVSLLSRDCFIPNPINPSVIIPPSILLSEY
jgi:hypothetical protein